MTYKCKICGGQTTIDLKNGIAICDYCGTKQALPLFTEDSARLLYERGNAYLSQNEYDKAEVVFNQLLTINPNDPELYWDLVLCKYGVTYVKDPKTAKYIPTCNRTHYTPIFKDENYLKAIELSSGEKNTLYKSDAETIDNIQKGILAVSKKEKPFDIFISYKETDVNGNRTQDSIAAQELYEKLTEAGYKVFFSRITLEDKVGTEYEPYIYAALYSSKVMLTICSSKENIEAVWVKNEWSRFLTLRQNDSSKTILPLYFDMQKTELPDEFALLSSYDMAVDGFEQELLRGIKKLIPLPILLAQKRKKIKKVWGIIAACTLAVAVVATGILLPIYIKNVKYGELYTEATQLFENAKYEEASVIFTELNDYKNATEMVEKCKIQPDYDVAEKLYYDGYYAEATWAFEKLGNYEDAELKKEQSELSWRKDLGTVATDDFDEYSNSFYYIDGNGTVKGADGAAHSNLSLEKHGKIISIAPSYDKLYALHEDGYVSNAVDESGKWQDIVKISRTLINTNIALRADGTMIYGETTESNGSDRWIEGISEWNNIVDFELFYADGEAYGDGVGAVIGIKADGSLCVVSACYLYGEDGWPLSKFDTTNLDSVISKFSNIKTLSFSMTGTQNSNEVPFEIIALTKDGKIQSYKNGKFSESDATDVCDITAKFSLKTNGNIVDEDGKIVVRDIVNIIAVSGGRSAVAITRTGTVYKCNWLWDEANTGFEASNIKATVYDEWTSRLD